MDCLATSSAAASLIEQDEPAKPSSLQCPRRAVALSDPSERDRASGTLGNISLDDDEEAITTDDEYYDTRSETSSISSLRALESSFYQIASASRESLDSFLSILAPSLFETRKMNIRELAEYLQSKHRLSKTVILDMTTYHSPSVILITHMFVVLRVKQGHREGWIRLDRRAEDPFRVSFLFSGMRGPVKDEVCHILFS